MKKILFTFAIISMFMGSLMLTSCGGDDDNTTTDNDSSNVVTDQGPQPGEVPFDFPMVGTDAVAGEYVLAPSYDFIEDAWEDVAEDITPSFIFYSATMVEPGDVESKLSQISDDVMIPNSLIIRIPAGQEAHVGDMVLTWWQSGSGMERGIVVDDTDPTQPVVVYLDASYDEFGEDEEQLEANSFVVLTSDWQPGTQIAYEGDYDFEQWTVLRVEGDKVLAKGWAGSTKVLEKSKCTPIPVTMDVAVGDVIQIPYIGSYQEGTVIKVDAAKARVWVETEWAGDIEEEAVCIGDITTGLPITD